jgi:hypothetical protein
MGGFSKVVLPRSRRFVSRYREGPASKLEPCSLASRDRSAKMQPSPTSSSFLVAGFPAAAAECTYVGGRELRRQR